MKEPLLLLHGALGSSAQLLKLSEYLNGQYDVYMMSFSGHGGKAIDTPFSIEVFSRDVREFMEEHSISPAHIFGYSMGGYVALHLAYEHPEMVQKIITYGTKFDWSPEFAAKEIRLLDPDKMEEKVPAFADTLKSAHHPSDWRKVVLSTVSLLEGLGHQKLLDDKKLQQIKQQVLIGIGTEDDTVSVKESRKAASLLSHGELHIFEGSEHPIQKVDYKELAETISAFISGS